MALFAVTMTVSQRESTQPTDRLQRIWDEFVAWHTTVDSPHPNIAEGLRMAVGIFVPILISWERGHISWGVLVALTTFWVLLCDTGGSFRSKAVSMAVSSLAIIAAFIVGAWACQSSTAYFIGIFVWLSVAALVGITGSAAAQAGLMSSTMFIVSVALRVPGEFWIRTWLCCLGALWAMALSLALWPLQASSPVFDALAMSYSKLAELLEAFWSGTLADRPVNNMNFALAFDSFITQLENTRTTWGAIRSRRAGPSARSIQLLRLVDLLDSIGGSVVALRQLLGRLDDSPRRAAIMQELHSLTADLITIVQILARAIPKRGRTLDSKQVDAALKRAEERIEALFTESNERDQFSSIPELKNTVLNLVKQIRKATKTIANLESKRDEKDTPKEVSTEPETKPFHFWAMIRNNLSFESDGFRHALRLGVIAVLGQTIATVSHLPRGYWIPVTILFILKPNFGGTLQRAVLRLTGTVLGGLIAAVLSLTIREEVILIAILPVLAFAALSVRPINYGLYTLALTPMIMVMLDVGHTANWETSFLRVLHTFVGGILAVLGGYILFPVWEKQKLPGELAAAIKANADFLRTILAKSPEENEERRWRQLQRTTGLALANAATVGQRVLSEPTHLGGEVESSLAVINDAREIFQILSAIMESHPRSSGFSENLGTLGTDLADFLDELASAVPPDQPLPKPPNATDWKERLHQEQGQASTHLSTDFNGEVARQGSLITLFDSLIDAIQALYSAIQRLHDDEKNAGKARSLAGRNPSSSDSEARYASH
jgi:uncharacterized membrane protein YccC